VSEKLVTLQIKNSSIYHQLSQEEQQILANKEIDPKQVAVSTDLSKKPRMA
jgi:hypothetical protein